MGWVTAYVLAKKYVDQNAATIPITTEQIADGAVTYEKIADNAVYNSIYGNKLNTSPGYFYSTNTSEIYYANDSFESTNSTTPVLMKNIKFPSNFPNNTTVRVYFEFKSEQFPYRATVELRVFDGSSESTIGSWSAYDSWKVVQVDAQVSANYELRLYGYISESYSYCDVQNFRILGKGRFVATVTEKKYNLTSST